MGPLGPRPDFFAGPARIDADGTLVEIVETTGECKCSYCTDGMPERRKHQSQRRLRALVIGVDLPVL